MFMNDEFCDCNADGRRSDDMPFADGYAWRDKFSNIEFIIHHIIFFTTNLSQNCAIACPSCPSLSDEWWMPTLTILSKLLANWQTRSSRNNEPRTDRMDKHAWNGPTRKKRVIERIKNMCIIMTPEKTEKQNKTQCSLHNTPQQRKENSWTLMKNVKNMKNVKIMT